MRTDGEPQYGAFLQIMGGRSFVGEIFATLLYAFALTMTYTLLKEYKEAWSFLTFLSPTYFGQLVIWMGVKSAQKIGLSVTNNKS